MSDQFNKFQQLRIEGWRQFVGVDIELHPRLTVITGANGAGKSSLLRIFSRHFGFDRPFFATPRRNSSGGYSYSTGIFVTKFFRIFGGFFSKEKTSETEVGSLAYTNGVHCLLNIPENPNVSYSIGVSKQQQVRGIHIDSHQPVPHFQQVGNIPTNLMSPKDAYTSYNNEIINRYAGGHTGYSPTYRIKEAIISMAMFGEGNQHVQGNDEVLAAYKGFVEALRKMLPDSLGFIDISVRPPDVVLVTKSGEFIIDASSGGLMTLIDLTWRLYMFSLEDENFVVTIDEPENHLHPTMQRSLMRQLLETFPKTQFIIATHSPFMVSSIRDSFVYVLRYLESETDQTTVIAATETRRVVSQRLDTINKAGSAGEILREVLGVSTTIPEWVEEGINGVVERYKTKTISKEMLGQLRTELKELGYDELYPDALAALTENK